MWNNRSGLRDFLMHVMRFPISVMSAFGYTSAVYVFDHFDCASCTIVQTDHPTKYKKPLSITELLREVIKESPFFVASKDDAEFWCIRYR